MAYPEHMRAQEAQIIDAILIAAMANAYSVSVYDGEGWPLKHSTDLDAIRANVAATDETTLYFMVPRARVQEQGKVVGNVLLIHGNDCDVISDCSDNEAIADLLKPAEAIANVLREGK